MILYKGFKTGKWRGGGNEERGREPQTMWDKGKRKSRSSIYI